MTVNNQASNKIIAKNSLLLYFRMFLMMAINLYTSRVVLDALGQTDFGLYNVVGGIVTMFTVVNFAMSCATARFITFKIGEGDKEALNKVFGTSIIIHIIIAIIILILAETIGLWFLMNKLVIPADRIVATHWVYQFSILSCMIMIMSVPYNALITSHEKMGAFAYISIFEAILKLIIVYLLSVCGIDKLILYAFLMFTVQLIIRIIYQLYCVKTFKDVSSKFECDRIIMKDMFGFAIWSLAGSAANIFATQGQNILLNMFFGPAVNAARGIAVQVQSAIQQFASNFQNAMSPQINKSYARGDIDYMHSLINASSKYSFFLLFFISLPVCFEIKTLLGWWLVETPDHSVAFIRLMLIISVISALANPISYASGATGKIRNFQLIVGGVMCMIVPMSYFALKISPKPEYVFLVQIFVSIIGQIARLVLIKSQINLSLRSYFKEVVLNGAKLTLIAPILPALVYFNASESVLSFFVVCFLCVVSTCVSIYFFCIKQPERIFVHNQIKKLLSKF